MSAIKVYFADESLFRCQLVGHCSLGLKLTYNLTSSLSNQIWLGNLLAGRYHLIMLPSELGLRLFLRRKYPVIDIP